MPQALRPSSTTSPGSFNHPANKRATTQNRSRVWLATGSGLALGLLGTILIPSQGGCIYHDTCIKVTSPGHDWCRNLSNALQWPADGTIDDAIPVTNAEGAPPQGCRCFNDAEAQILEDAVPACRYDELLAEIEVAGREECQSLVMPGYDHNCWQATGPDASIPETEFAQLEPGSCIGNCEYGGPPLGGSCPDPNPYECEEDGGYNGVCETTGTIESTGDDGLNTSGDSGLDTSGGVHELDAELFVTCEGTVCEIDTSFAMMLYDAPELLLNESTRLYYDDTTRRHVFVDVEPGSVAHTLGLRTGDQLESVDGRVIDSLDAALLVYASSSALTHLDVRVMRGTQWLDFYYSFVR